MNAFAYVDSGSSLSITESILAIALVVGYFAVLIAIAKWAGRKGHSAVLNLLVGFFLSPILQLAIAALMSDRRRRSGRRDHGVH